MLPDDGCGNHLCRNLCSDNLLGNCHSPGVVLRHLLGSHDCASSLFDLSAGHVLCLGVGDNQLGIDGAGDWYNLRGCDNLGPTWLLDSLGHIVCPSDELSAHSITAWLHNSRIDCTVLGALDDTCLARHLLGSGHSLCAVDSADHLLWHNLRGDHVPGNS